MSCTDCLDNQFFTDKSQEFLTDHGIPVNVSKPILKILYHSLDDCGLNCCNNSVEVDSVVIGQDGKETCAKLTVTSTTQGILFPRMTTTEKNAIASVVDGLVVYDTTLNKLCVRANGAWETITSV